MRTATIHAGLEKTGTTAIQGWLHANRAALLREGVYFPQSLGKMNHTRLVAACLDDGVTDNLKAFFLSRQDWSETAWREDVRSAFDAELAQTEGWSHLVISSELISSRLHSKTEVARLAEWVGRHVDRLRFVVYLRRQDELAVSRFSTALREGHAGFDDVWADLSPNTFLALPSGRVATDEVEFYDYQRIISRFTALGDVDVTVRLYDPPGAPLDVVADFCSLLGLSSGSYATSDQRANPGLSAAAQYVIGELNRDNSTRWPSGGRNEPYRALLKAVEAELPGPPRLVTRAEAEAFLDRFADSNGAVEQQWFPAGMFSKSFRWPETADYSKLKSDLSPVLARYRHAAAALPKSEAPRTVTQRLMSSLLRWSGS